MTYKINNNSNLVFANLGIKEKYVGFYESLTDGDPRLKLFESLFYKNGNVKTWSELSKKEDKLAEKLFL